MRYFSLLLLIFLIVNCKSYCQTKQETSNFIKVTTPLKNNTFAIKEFTKDSVLLYTGKLSAIEPEIRQGKFYFYNKGKISATGEYDKDIPIGLWVYYNEVGDTLCKIDYSKVLNYLKYDAMNYTADSIINKNFSKKDKKYMNEKGTFMVVEEMPAYNGDETGNEFRKYIKQNLRYPIYAEKKKIEGIVWVNVIIDVNGKIKNPIIIRPVITDLNIEAIRVLSESSAWKPGYHKKTPVNVSYVFPITFKLEK